MRNPPRESQLLFLATAFLFLYSVALTLAPAVRLRSWQVEYAWQHWIGFLAWLAVFGVAAYLSARKLPEHDPYLLPVAGLLTGWGLLTVWRLFPDSGLRQSMWLLVAGLIYLVGLNFPVLLSLLRRYKYLWLTLGLFLTALTLIFGTNPLGYGPRMWLGCCGIYLQPSEPLKFLLVVYLAAYLADRLPVMGLPARRIEITRPVKKAKATDEQSSHKNRTPGSRVTHSGKLLPLLAPTLVMTGLSLLLLLIQRDLGTASIFLFIYFAILYVATGRKEVLLAALLVLVLFATIGYWMFDLVRLRIDAWLNPWLDPSGRSYQIVQSLLAVANGGLLGRGPGVGNPGLVPISHSDFIFAAISEETGLVGGLGVLLLLALFANRGLRLALSAPNAYQRYLATGLTCLIVAQSVLIIGGNLRLLPLTGVTLPFVSYGGSSLVVSFLSLLILTLISIQKDARPAFLPNPQNYLQLGAFLLAGLAAAAIVAAWWAVYRGPDLLTRTDNPRRAIADRYVERGELLDRHNKPINITTGSSGNYTREILYPPLSNVVGYTHPIYGQSGLEASMDSYLRGLQGNPGLTIWLDHLLYGQPPPGLDVRLSLDSGLQQTADQLLEDKTGALVLVNAQTGEILAMASHPTFDANQLEANWESLVNDPGSPLLNRALLGDYPVGTGLAPELTQSVLDETGQATTTEGQQASPLEMALAAAALSNNGIRPAAHLSLAVDTPSAGWVLLPAEGEAQETLSPQVADQALNELAIPAESIWQSADCVVDPGEEAGDFCWYTAGTLPEWQGTPLALAVLLEKRDPNLAKHVGRMMLKAAMQP